MNAIKNLAIMAIVMTMCACSSGHRQKSLVLYYSQTGTTQAVAEEIARLTGADIEAVEVVEAYDGTYDETIQRCLKEREEGTLPALKPLSCDVNSYDVIYLGYPVWFGTFARPMIALLNDLKLEGKKVVPFCTFGSGGLEATAKELTKAFPGAELINGYGVRTARLAAMPAEVERFLKENRLIEGDVDPLPLFSDRMEVGEEEKAIFNNACGDYKFPLGTPLAFSLRQRPEGIEYEFIVDSGAIIYVLAPLGDGSSKPEFTKVVRD